MVLMYNNKNPSYSDTIHNIWTKHKLKIPGNLRKTLVCYKRPPNLCDRLVRAQFSDHYNENTAQIHCKLVPLQTRLMFIETYTEGKS